MLDLDCADVEVKLDGAALRVVFVNTFVQDLMVKITIFLINYVGDSAFVVDTVMCPILCPVFYLLYKERSNRENFCIPLIGSLVFI